MYNLGSDARVYGILVFTKALNQLGLLFILTIFLLVKIESKQYSGFSLIQQIKSLFSQVMAHVISMNTLSFQF